MLCRGDSIGVFQVESRAQISMLPRLQPRCFYDLVIEVAIVLPGPIQGDMVHPYLKRRQGLEPVSYPNDAVRSVLERTLGVPIFQEQVIQLAMVAAGFSGGEADRLRRAMASWGKNGNLGEFERRLIEGMQARGHSEEFAKRLFRQIQGFGEYGFPESHSASFALLVYASAWLKCHHPAAFYCALLNSQPMGFYSPSQLVQDARRHNVQVLPVTVEHSDWDHQLEVSDNTVRSIRLGMRLVKGFDKRAAERIVDARNNRPFSNLRDLTQRARLQQNQLSALIRANALRKLGSHRHQSHWQARAIETGGSLLEHHESTASLSDGVTLTPPSEISDLHADYNSIGLTLNRHPMAMLREQMPFRRCKTHQQLAILNHGRFVRTAGLVTGRQRPGTASGVIFLTLEDETGNTNIVVWRDLQTRFRQPLLTGKLLLVKGILEHQDSVTHVIAGEIIDYSHRLEGVTMRSRDFH
jgi:error-prone DNA polymerase